jgi:hypothetical protein
VRERINRHLSAVLAIDTAAARRPSAQPRSRHRVLLDAISRPAVRGAAVGLRAVDQVVVPAEFSGRDYAIFLLRIAAEIEHSLMAQYLFAAYTLGGPRVPADKRDDVRAWQETILGIAKEEMGHLITVQNLLTVLGAPRQFDRDDYPNQTPFYPFGFRLEPLSLESLATYVCAESPAAWSGPESVEIKARAQAGAGEMVNRVGALFEELIRLFDDSTAVADDEFQASTRVFQANWDEWGRGYREGQRGTEAMSILPDLPAPELIIMSAQSRADALDALRAIADQGEGLEVAADENASHFMRFLAIYRAMKDLGAGISDVVRPVATNPTTGGDGGGDPADPDTSTAITHDQAQLWGHLFNVRYRKLLVSLAHAFELASGLTDLTALSPRGWLIHRCFAEMYNLRAIAGLLVALPVSADDPAGPRAGPPFQMPYTLTLSPIETNRWRVHRDLLDAAQRLCTDLQVTAAADSPGQEYLAALAQQDLIERGQIEQFINAAPAPGGPTP